MHDADRLPSGRIEEPRSRAGRRALLLLLHVLAFVFPALGALAQVSVPFTQNDLVLSTLSSEVSYTVLLSSLPLRPELIAEVVPDDGYLDMALQVEISGCTLVNPFGSCPAERISPPGTGPRSVSYEPYRCIVPNANGSNYVGHTCNVKVRAMSFGSAGAPARFDLTIRGVTEVPTSTIFGSVTTSVPSVSASIPTTTAPFINEGTNFRWIYDLDHDDVFITPVVGRCEVTNQGGILMPYTYQFQGAPTYQGLDCCTWQIDSSAGVTGTGQALFFINVDGSIPANQPGDLDLDGIKDLCDNCAAKPNGPLLGTCTSGSKAGSLCRSNPQCINGPCSLSQDDQNLDGTGNACVPEPGLGAGILIAWIGLTALAQRRARGTRRPMSPDGTESEQEE